MHHKYIKYEERTSILSHSFFLNSVEEEEDNVSLTAGIMFADFIIIINFTVKINVYISWDSLLVENFAWSFKINCKVKTIFFLHKFEN